MWKDTIRKKTGDEEYEEGKTLDFTNVMRDRRSAESYKTGDTMKDMQITEAFNKMEKQIREALKGIDFDSLMRTIMPHGRTKGTYKNKEELVAHLTQEAINRIKSDELYKGDIISKKRSFESSPTREMVEQDLNELTENLDYAMALAMRVAKTRDAKELIQLLQRAQYLVSQRLRR